MVDLEIGDLILDLEIGDLIIDQNNSKTPKCIPFKSGDRDVAEEGPTQTATPNRDRQDAQGCDPGGPTLGVCCSEPQAPSLPLCELNRTSRQEDSDTS